METRFEWDPDKARRNQLAHGISFERAKQVFGDQRIVVRENVEVDGEQRCEAIGMTGSLVLLLVVFVDRVKHGVEVIRIISARKATDYERCAYEDQFR